MNRKGLYATAFIIISSIMYGCNKHHESFASIVKRLLDYYTYEDIDSLKAEAVHYIADNIQWHYTMLGDSIVADSESLTYDFLKEHIDYIFEVWRLSPYAHYLNFEEFKEYLLPYSAVNGIGPNLTAKERGRWMKLHGFTHHLDNIDDVVLKYNITISNLRKSNKGSGNQIRKGLSDLNDMSFVDCSDKVHHCILNLRSIGVPCVAERNWCYRQLISHHVHCAIYNPQERKFFRFNAEDTASIPDSSGWNYVEMQNVCRLTYSRQYTTPYFLKQYEENTVYPFNTPCIKDITRKSYAATINIKTDSRHNIVYLATFNRSQLGLMPVTWGLVDSCRRTATFNNILPSTLYFPGISDDGIFKPIGVPIYFEIVDDSIVCRIAKFALGSEQLTKERVVLTRKYPVKEKTINIINQLKGSIIEASNVRDFSHKTVLDMLIRPLRPERQIIKIRNHTPYKYYRLTATNESDMLVSILRWIDENGHSHIGDVNNPAYNDDMTDAPKHEHSIEIAFSEPTKIESIEIAPLNSDNGVTSGHVYQLKYYDINSGTWKLITSSAATSREITFDNVPINSLLWLIDCTAGQEEMPFIYNNNQQKFLYPDLIIPLP